MGQTKSDRLTRALLIAAGVAFWLAFLVAGLRVWPQPMTQEQALARMAEWGPEGTARRVVALDAILRATPAVTLPDTLALLVDADDLIVTYRPAEIAVDVPPYLSYRIKMPDRRFADFVPRRPWWRTPLELLAAGAAGVLAGLLLAR